MENHSNFTTDLQKQIFKLVGVKNPMSLERFVW